MQEDFFLNAPVREELIDEALWKLDATGAGMIRLYPCPGADTDYDGDPRWGIVWPGSDYRISCQASIWEPAYLGRITGLCKKPNDFEINGTKISAQLSQLVLAFKREVKPWPMEYLCSAISRGLWNPDAIELCNRLNIPIDLSMRAIEA
jgi:hypothetical protein